MEKSASQASERSKKPYDKPQIIYKQPLEAMAVACTLPNAKASVVPGGCNPAQLFS